eukprot:5209237-Pyramimonas_sp.AAC.1
MQALSSSWAQAPHESCEPDAPYMPSMPHRHRRPHAPDQWAVCAPRVPWAPRAPEAPVTPVRLLRRGNGARVSGCVMAGYAFACVHARVERARARSLLPRPQEWELGIVDDQPFAILEPKREEAASRSSAAGANQPLQG